MNAPDRFLTWRWEEEPEDDLDENDVDANIPPSNVPGVVSGPPRRLQYIKDSKRIAAGTFILGKEDHTLGNLIRIQLLRDPQVRYAGYRMPHPLIFDCHIRVETMDSSLTPVQVFASALADLQLETEILESKFNVSFNLSVIFEFLLLILV
jgi:DNA-directed RNA polymerase II subunit RPB11